MELWKNMTALELFRRLVCPDIQFDTTLRNYNPNRRGNFYDLGPELRRKNFSSLTSATHIFTWTEFADFGISVPR